MRELRSAVEAAVAELAGSIERTVDLALWLGTDAAGRKHPEIKAPKRTERGAVAQLQPFADPAYADQIGDVYEAVKLGRKTSGSFYTPPALVEHLLTQTLDPVVMDGAPRVLDPACGAGNFLVPVAARGATVFGVDLDPVAIRIARTRLWTADPNADWAELAMRVFVADGLKVIWPGPFDAVIGNPPFLNQLTTATAMAVTDIAELADGLGPYADLSARFLRRALTLTRPGGRVGLVQPLSLLATRDATPLRAAIADAGAVRSLWWSSTPVFPGTDVLTCAPVIEIGATQGSVEVATGATYTTSKRRASKRLITGEWGFLIQAGLGIPDVRLPKATGTLADLATCSADFRDQYYGLVPHLLDRPEGLEDDEAPLITTGLIDPAVCRWGEVGTKFNKQSYAAPAVSLAGLRETSLANWATARLVPKVLLATQGKVLEAVVDEHGAWLPSVPTITLAPESPDDVWRILAVLLAPPIVAGAAARYAGTAMSLTAIKLSARQVAELPLPVDEAAWQAGADAARAAQHATDAIARHDHLVECATHMCAAYGVDEGSLAWWTGRLPRR